MHNANEESISRRIFVNDNIDNLAISCDFIYPQFHVFGFIQVMKRKHVLPLPLSSFSN